MILAPGGREYARWSYMSSDTITSVDVEFDSDGTWHPTVVTQPAMPGQAGELKILVAGPLAAGNPGGTIVLASGSHAVQVRFNDTPELVVRGGGTISVG